MPNKEILRQIVSKQKKELSFKPGSIRREVLDKIMHWFKDDRIIILMGIRRCGKSTLLKQIMDQQSKWCYINFKDERLLDFKAQDFEMLNESLMEFYGQDFIEHFKILCFKVQ